MSYASYQTAPAPEGTPTTQGRPEGQRAVTVQEQRGAIELHGDGTITGRASAYGLNTADFSTELGGVLAQARTPTGSPRTGSAIQPTDIIAVNGMELSVALAEQMGMIARDANGLYREIAGGVEAAKKDAELEPEDMPDDAVALSDARAEATLADICQTVSGSVQVSALHQLVTEGTVSPQTIARAASEAQVEPGEMQARVQSIAQGFEAQAAAAVKSWGSDNPGEFFEWARENKPREFQNAMRSHGMERNTKGYEPLYREFVSTVAERDPEAVLNAQFGSGITARKVNGEVILTLPGAGQMPFKTALRAGLISVKGA